MVHTIDKQIIDTLPLLKQEEKKSVLDYINTYLKIKKDNPRISIAEYNKELEISEKEFEDGNYITQSEFLKEIEKW